MLFKQQISRKPDLYPWCQQYIDAMWAGHWTPNEFTFAPDKQDFLTELSEVEKGVIIRDLSAIGQIEIAVKTFWAKLGDHFPHPSISDLGYTMANIEVIHNKAYEKLLDVLDLGHVFEENLKLDIIANRVKYLRKYNEKKYDDDKKQYIYSLILFTLFVENVSLFSQFYVILWFNKYRKVMKHTAQQVQYTKNEELIHGLCGSQLINQARIEYPELFDEELTAKVKRASKEALKAEEKIIDWILGVFIDLDTGIITNEGFSGENLDRYILREYVKGRINSSLEMIGFEKVFELDEALISKTQWMEEAVHANFMTDFFHKKPVEYGKGTQSFSIEEIFE